ncbi:MAG: GntR family transcriptional regulator [Ktedonobacteraceae bacterium]|nr:GntR family transcriptional regulator [Ktedonobacteraceae bacterium]
MNSPGRIGKGSANPILTKLTIAEQIAAALRHEIVTGQLAAGTRLPQIETAQRFGVSTTPVREAFGLLQSDGLVQIDPHRGVSSQMHVEQRGSGPKVVFVHGGEEGGGFIARGPSSL